ncbi:DUF4386 family protein [Pengzhenrongella frigida]|uniref:DUF4386 family protein n=1 Tax=Pengzhenrongella frigida TaxID=1259133 RepID=A0A4Q5N3L3_9MICO|nr:DUF4386 family protein [Cellulomonas sp. HLT2-17]RYV52829.1 DUF4386 family protein [Cellulomonas sp. HLT2-17]
MFPVTQQGAPHDKAGGLAALYLALAYIAAMPFFLLVVDYPAATTAAEKVTSIVRNYPSMYAMYLVSYVFLGVVLAVLVLSLFERLRHGSDLGARVATVLGLMWATALVLSGLIFNHGMGTVVSLAEKSPEQAAVVWQAIEPVTDSLSGAGGETLAGLWLLVVSWTALRGRALPTTLVWFGAATGLIGLVSTVPALHEASYAFGLLQIIWFAWLATVLLTHRANALGQIDRQLALGAV